MSALAKASDKVDDIAGLSSALKAQLKTAFSNTTLFKTMLDTNPDAIIDVFKRMDDVDLKKIGDSLDATGTTKLKKALADSGNLSLSAKMFPDGATVRTALTIGAGVGLLAYLDKKFEDEEEDFKNCMAACVPHNWDQYEQGGIQASELEYSTEETLKDYQITPIDNQPYCVSPNKDCEEYCQPKCDEETKSDLPFSSVPERAAEEAGGLLKALFGGLLDGLGLDTTTVGYASSASASMCSLVLLLMLMQQFR
jgi:hypothetical protein